MTFQVDIHPAAKIGRGIMLDHATGIVVGETAVIENDVSILQSVTLGGTGKTTRRPSPKIREGVMIGAGAKILGNIEVGRGAKIGAGCRGAATGATAYHRRWRSGTHCQVNQTAISHEWISTASTVLTIHLSMEMGSDVLWIVPDAM